MGAVQVVALAWLFCGSVNGACIARARDEWPPVAQLVLVVLGPVTWVGWGLLRLIASGDQ